MIDGEKMESSINDVTIAQILLTALEKLDYKTFCDELDDGNPFSGFLGMNTQTAVPESKFNEMKEGLKSAIRATTIPSIFDALGEFLNGVKEMKDYLRDDSDEYDETDDEPVASFKTVAKIDKTKPEQKDEKRINLTGEPAIDAEIIFNMVKRHK